MRVRPLLADIKMILAFSFGAVAVMLGIAAFVRGAFMGPPPGTRCGLYIFAVYVLYATGGVLLLLGTWALWAGVRLRRFWFHRIPAARVVPRSP